MKFSFLKIFVVFGVSLLVVGALQLGALTLIYQQFSEKNSVTSTASVSRAAPESKASFLTALQSSLVLRGWLLIFLITVACAIGGLLLFFMVINRRFTSFLSIVKQFESGNLTQRVHASGADEMAEIEHAFNAMADKMQADMDALKRSNAMRKELVASISHDLRSPLTSIRGYVETLLLREESISAEDRNRYLQVVLKNTTSLITLVDDLFELSRLSAGERPVQKHFFSLDELVENIWFTHNQTAQSKKIELRKRIDEQAPRVWGDRGLIERAISNLVSNAIKYTEEHGKVTIALKYQPERERVAIEVVDTGIGIPEEDLPYVFDRFYRVDKDRSKATGGAGLGLAIVKKVVNLHNQRIAITSSPGVGTQVAFAISTTQDSDDPPGAADD